jgi:hypothetical protein
MEGGLYSPLLLQDFLATELSDIGAQQRFVDIGLTNVLTGNYDDMLAADVDAHLQDIMLASFTYAGFFPPAVSMGSSWFDGTTIYDIDVYSAVNNCLLTHAIEDVTVDIILTSEKVLRQVDASNYNSMNMLARYLEVAHYYSVMDGLLRARFAYPKVNFRYIIAPSQALPNTNQKLPLVISLNITFLDDDAS